MPSGIYTRTEETKRKIGLNGFHYGMLGRHHSLKTKIKLSELRKDEKNANWKGNDVKYSGLHIWIVRHKGKPPKCEHCGKTGKKEGRRWNIDWANKNHKYRRILEDWFGLCKSCHGEYDKTMGFRKRKNLKIVLIGNRQNFQ